MAVKYTYPPISYMFKGTLMVEPSTMIGPNGAKQYQGQQVFSCSICGGTVLESDQGHHTGWHHFGLPDLFEAVINDAVEDGRLSELARFKEDLARGA